MILVEDGLGLVDVAVVRGADLPGDGGQVVEVGAGDGVLGGGRVDPLQPAHLLFSDLAHVFGHVRAFDLRPQFVRLAQPGVLLPQLLLDLLHLLAQQEFLLAFPHLLGDLGLHLALDLQALYLVGQVHVDLFQPLQGIYGFEEFLQFVDGEVKVESHQVG